jgi:2-amino-4-hydroxy-6-hydroxymethyldihydropteridine diphosphokinase
VIDRSAHEEASATAGGGFSACGIRFVSNADGEGDAHSRRILHVAARVIHHPLVSVAISVDDSGADRRASVGDEAAHLVLLGLGANLGEPVEQLARAVELLRPHVRIDRVSSLYRTEPVGHADQPDFHNLVVTGTTALEPMQLLHAVQEIEDTLGRRRSFRNAPRTLDIDLLACGDRVMRTLALTLPHPRLHLRGFVLHPLAEVAPEWRHHVLGRTARELLSSATALERVEALGPLPRAGAALAPVRPSG